MLQTLSRLTQIIPENRKWYRILFLYHLTIDVIVVYYNKYTLLGIHILTNKPRCKNMDSQTYIEFDRLYHCHILFHTVSYWHLSSTKIQPDISTHSNNKVGIIILSNQFS